MKVSGRCPSTRWIALTALGIVVTFYSRAAPFAIIGRTFGAFVLSGRLMSAPSPQPPAGSGKGKSNLSPFFAELRRTSSSTSITVAVRSSFRLRQGYGGPSGAVSAPLFEAEGPSLARAQR